MAAKARPKKESDIMEMAKLLRDEKKLAELGKRVIQRQLSTIVSRRTKLDPIAWEDAWVDSNGWGTDVWTNAWTDDSWEDHLGSDQRNEYRVRPETLEEVVDAVFTAEEKKVLRQQGIV